MNKNPSLTTTSSDGGTTISKEPMAPVIPLHVNPMNMYSTNDPITSSGSEITSSSMPTSAFTSTTMLTSLIPLKETMPMEPPMEVILEGKRVIREFLQANKCHELIKNSSKVVVFDISIPVNLAFFALVEHDIKAAPLWNSNLGRFVGTITETDFLVILKQLYLNGSSSISDLSEYSLASWQTMNPSFQQHDLPMMSGEQHMVSISPESTLYDACVLLNKYGIHRLPILDIEQNSVLTIITRSSILDYLVSCFREDRRLFDQSIYDLGIGTYTNIITVTETTPLIQVLELLAVHKVGAIPITDVNGGVINILCVSDITELAKERYGMSQLELPVIELLRLQCQDGIVSGGGDGISGLFCCSKSDTLHTLFEKFAATKTRRLVCLDNENRCVGLVSLSDLFRYFLI